jgi:LPXTG-motif cell wall-anchored protein
VNPAPAPTVTPEPTSVDEPEPTVEATPTETPEDEPADISEDESGDEPEETSLPITGGEKNTALLLIIALLSLLTGLSAGGAFYLYKTRKELTINEEIIHNPVDADDDGINSDPGSGV